jgi:6-phosphogluconolactonase
MSTFDDATGKLGEPELAAETRNPSFLAIHPNRRWLYAVGEISELNGQKNVGAVTAFSIDSATGKLTELNQQGSGGGGPCHVSVDPSGRCAMVANYGGGSAGALPIRADGRLSPIGNVVQHLGGSNADARRQSAPHAHSINPDAAGRYAFVADLGLDKVMIYKLDAANGKLTPNDPPFAAVAPGAGPRHFAFHPNGRWAYVINEMALTLTVFNYDAATGKLDELETVSTVPAGTPRTGSTAEVQVHPSGKFVYGSNRDPHNTIASFKVDPSTGKLTLTGLQGEGVKTPRNFTVDPTGKFALVANQGGGSVLVFRIDPTDGTLKPTEHRVAVDAPVCVKFMALN